VEKSFESVRRLNVISVYGVNQDKYTISSLLLYLSIFNMIFIQSQKETNTIQTLSLVFFEPSKIV
jgi:hypothetical protein